MKINLPKAAMYMRVSTENVEKNKPVLEQRSWDRKKYWGRAEKGRNHGNRLHR